MRKWVKLYTKILMDPDMHRLSNGAYRACVNLIVLAGILDKSGELGTASDVAFHLRLEVDCAQEYLNELAKFDFARAKKGVWFLRNWDKLQNKPASDAPEAVKARVQKHRKNKPKDETETQISNESVTTLHENGNESVTPSNEPRLEERREEQKEHTPAPKTPARVTSSKIDKPDPLKELAAVFEQASGVKLESIPRNKRGPLYWNPLSLMLKTADGTASEELQAAIAHLRKAGMTISDPNSVLKTFNGLHGAGVTGGSKRTFLEVT